MGVRGRGAGGEGEVAAARRLRRIGADALLLDCDGTLVDSESLANEVLREDLGSRGVVLSADEVARRFTGVRMARCAELVAELTGRALPETWVAGIRARMDAAFESRLRAVDGAADLLRAIDVPHCVASGGPRHKTERTLTLTGLRPHLRGPIFSSYDVGAWKPDPALFLHAAAALGVAPSRCAVLEDSDVGIAAGLAAGMRVLAFRPDGARDDLPSGVTRVRRLADVPALL